jgi:hypothetical protein
MAFHTNNSQSSSCLITALSKINLSSVIKTIENLKVDDLFVEEYLTKIDPNTKILSNDDISKLSNGIKNLVKDFSSLIDDFQQLKKDGNKTISKIISPINNNYNDENINSDYDNLIPILSHDLNPVSEIISIEKPNLQDQNNPNDLMPNENNDIQGNSLAINSIEAEIPNNYVPKRRKMKFGKK